MNLVVQLLLVVTLILGTQLELGGTCETSLKLNGRRLAFVKCLDLGAQGASLAWKVTYQNKNEVELEVAFSGVAPMHEGWVGWGLNPNIGEPQMMGSSVFVAFHATNGSTLLPYRLTTSTMGGTPLTCSSIDYVVKDTALQISNKSMVMFVQLSLNASQTQQLNAMNHVWNRGPSVTHFRPAPHATQPNDLKTVAQINMISGYPTSSSISSTKDNLLKNHAILNTISWGIFLPLGVMFARYFKLFSTASWFYLHISLQCIGYVLGVSGWATGLSLDSESNGTMLQKHRNIGMVLFVFSTLQVMALVLRPNKEHKSRIYWNIYHLSIGYSVVVLGILNVFVGFSIMIPKTIWSHTYIYGIAILGVLSLLMEVLTWITFFKKRDQQQRFDSTIFTHTKHFRESSDLKINGSFSPTSPSQHILRVL